MLGPCHLLQLSNFFQTDNVFFQYFRDGSLIKFDCPSFILAKREQVKRSKFVSSRVTWRLKEFDAFNVSLESADILIISFEDILSDNPYVIEDELLFRYEGNKKSSMKVVSLDINERAELLKKMIDSIIYRASPDANIYILDSVLTKNTPKYIKEVRLVYSHLLYKHYSHILEIIDMTSYKTIKGASIDDGVHLDRLAYRQLFLDIVNKDKKSIISDYSAFENNQYFASKYKKIRLALKRNIGDRSWLFRISKIVTKYLNV